MCTWLAVLDFCLMVSVLSDSRLPWLKLVGGPSLVTFPAELGGSLVVIQTAHLVSDCWVDQPVGPLG